MESLKIQIPEGFEVQDFNKQTGEVTFREKPKPIKERIKTIDDVLEAKGLSQETFKEKYGSIPKHLQSQLLAELLTEVLNEGWEPDWKDEDQWKYYAWFYMCPSAFRFGDCVDQYSGSVCASRLCFRTRELAEYAGTQFTSLYREFMIKE